MSNLLFDSGRLAWPAVIAVVFIAATILLFDLMWRTVTMSFESLAMAFIIVILVGSVLLFAMSRLLSNRRRSV